VGSGRDGRGAEEEAEFGLLRSWILSQAVCSFDGGIVDRPVVVFDRPRLSRYAWLFGCISILTDLCRKRVSASPAGRILDHTSAHLYSGRRTPLGSDRHSICLHERVGLPPVTHGQIVVGFFAQARWSHGQ
jgi:hypothetical protein